MRIVSLCIIKKKIFRAGRIAEHIGFFMPISPAPLLHIHDYMYMKICDHEAPANKYYFIATELRKLIDNAISNIRH